MTQCVEHANLYCPVCNPSIRKKNTTNREIALDIDSKLNSGPWGRDRENMVRLITEALDQKDLKIPDMEGFGILKPLVFVNGIRVEALKHKDTPEQYWLKIKGEWNHVDFGNNK